MKRILFILVTLCASLSTFAVTLTPYIHSESSGMDAKEENLMFARLKSVLTNTNILPGTTNNRFAISAKAHLVEKEMTATTPVMTAVRLEITVGVGDRIDGKCYSSTVITVKGVGDTEQKARMSAIKSIKPNSPALKEIVEQGAAKVIDYYNQNGERLLRDADNIIKSRPNDQESYQQAISLLTDCPTDCSLYDKFSEKVTSIYSAWVNHEAQRLYTWCKAQWSKKQDAENGFMIMDSLSVIESEAACYNDALALMDEVKEKMAADEAYARKLEEMEMAHRQAMEREKLEMEKADREYKREKEREDREYKRETDRQVMELAGKFADKWNGKFLSIF